MHSMNQELEILAARVEKLEAQNRGGSSSVPSFCSQAFRWF